MYVRLFCPDLHTLYVYIQTHEHTYTDLKPSHILGVVEHKSDGSFAFVDLCVCVCMYVCMNVCMNINRTVALRLWICVCVCMYVCMNECMYEYKSDGDFAFLNLYVCIYGRVCLWCEVYAYMMYMCMYVCMHVCTSPKNDRILNSQIHKYIYIYTHVINKQVLAYMHRRIHTYKGTHTAYMHTYYMHTCIHRHTYLERQVSEHHSFQDDSVCVDMYVCMHVCDIYTSSICV